MNLKNKFLSISFASLVLTAVFFAACISIEPSRLVAATATDTVIVTLDVTAGISITNAPDINMSTALGVAQNTAVGTSTWNVKTNNALGYTLAVKATATPAMVSGSNSIADYQTSSPNTWSVTSGTAAFGYSAFGGDVPTATWGTGSTCSGASAHAVSTTLKYKGFTTSDVTIATKSATTTSSGVDSTVCFAVEQNNFFIPSGTYKATIVATATTL